MKKMIKPLLVMILSLLLLVGCSGFTSDDSSIKVTDGNDGSVIITVINEDGEEETYVIKRGAGLAGIQEVPNAAEGYTSLIFLFENGLIEPETIKIPYPEDGREVSLRVNEETRMIEYQYEGDEEWIELLDLKEVDGKSAYEVYCSLLNEDETPLSEQEWLSSLHGKSAYEIYCDNLSEDGSPLSEQDWLKSLVGKDNYQLYVESAGDNALTLEEWLESLRGEKGKEVVSIKSMNGSLAYRESLANGYIGTELDWLKDFSGLDEDELKKLEVSDFNAFIFTYNDETVSDPVLEKRAGGRWYTGTVDPADFDKGMQGDYYFEYNHKVLYYKSNSTTWTKVVSLKPDMEICKVTFNLNDTEDEPAYYAFTGNYTLSENGITYEVYKGEYFRGGTKNNPEIPVPERAGYEFIGWYRIKDLPENFNPYVYIPFNDLTVVGDKDLVLYAQWKKL